MMSEHPLEHKNQPVPLGDLLSGAGNSPLFDAEIVDDVRKQKPKRKRKPKSSYLNWKVLIIAGVGIAILSGMTLVFIAPVRETVVMSESAVVVPTVNQESGANVFVTPIIQVSTVGDNPLVGKWMVTQEKVNSIKAGALVFVLNKSPNGEWYNVADSIGNIAMVTPEQLKTPTLAVPAGMQVPIGPFGSAINKMEKLVVVLDQHGDIAPGTPVYVMGWRAESGMWIYQVSKDLVKPEYVPAGFLAWAESG